MKPMKCRVIAADSLEMIPWHGLDLTAICEIVCISNTDRTEQSVALSKRQAIKLARELLRLAGEEK